ncbi:MAG TPA: META domain-containing protein [Bacteroidales bacterium]|nr:META domain-containing protein [Bacteroidales bacterium]
MKNNIRNHSLPIFLLTLFIVLQSCKKANESGASGIINTSWRLEYLIRTTDKSKLDFPADEPNRITIAFSDSLNTLMFNGICNSGSGFYDIVQKNNQLTIRDIKITLIHCRNIIWESYAVENLEKAASFSVKDNVLIIYTRGEYDLYFSKT